MLRILKFVTKQLSKCSKLFDSAQKKKAAGTLIIEHAFWGNNLLAPHLEAEAPSGAASHAPLAPGPSNLNSISTQAPSSVLAPSSKARSS